MAPGCGDVLGQDVSQPVMAERLAPGVGKERSRGGRVSLGFFSLGKAAARAEMVVVSSYLGSAGGFVS